MDVLNDSLTGRGLILLGLIIAMIIAAYVVVKFAPRKNHEVYSGGDSPVGIVERKTPPTSEENWDVNPATSAFGQVSSTPPPTIPGLGIAPELIGDRGVAAKEMFAGLPNTTAFETVEAAPTENTFVGGVYEIPNDFRLPTVPVESPQGFNHVDDQSERWVVEGEGTPDPVADPLVSSDEPPLIPNEYYANPVPVQEQQVSVPREVSHYHVPVNHSTVDDDSLPPMPPIFHTPNRIEEG